MKIVVAWYVTSCNLVDRPQRSGVLSLSSKWGGGVNINLFEECELYGRCLEQCDAISALRREGITGRRGMTALILTLGSGWNWVIKFTL